MLRPVWIFIAIVVWRQVCVISLTDFVSSINLRQLKELEDQKIREFKLDLQHILESQRIKRKRALLPQKEELRKKLLAVSSTTHVSIGSLVEYTVTSFYSLLYNGVDITLVGTQNGKIILLKVENDEFIHFSSLKTLYPVCKLQGFVYLNNLILAAVHQDEEDYFIQIYSFNSTGFKTQQRIPLPGESDISTIDSKNIYIAVISSKVKTNDGSSLHAQLQLYEWVGTQLDQVATANTKGATSVTIWEMDGMLYIVASQTRDDSGRKTNSKVFMYSHSKELINSQNIQTFFPMKVVHFSVGGSHYLVFIEKFDIVIYWWAGDQFIEYQKLKSSVGNLEAVDIAILRLYSGEVMIVVGSTNMVEYFIEDTTSHYISVWSHTLPENYKLHSISFSCYVNDCYMLPTFLNPHVNFTAYKLDFSPFILSTALKLDELTSCLNDLNSTLHERIVEFGKIESSLNNVWMLNKPETVTARINIHGNLHTNLLNATKVMITSEEISSYDHKSIEEGMKDLWLKANIMRENISETVRKLEEQVIESDLYFDTVNVSKGAMHRVNRMTAINGIQTTRLKFLLKTSSDQRMDQNVIFRDIYTLNLNLRGLLNNVDLEDLLLMNGSQIVKGHLSFFDIGVGNLAIEDGFKLNALQLTDIVKSKVAETIKGQKIFSNLGAQRIDVEGTTNQLKLSQIATDAVLLDFDQELSGKLNFTSDISVNLMNVKGSIGKSDVTFLAENAVSKIADELIQGKKSFISLVGIQDLNIFGRTNGLDVSDSITTTNTDQEISGSIIFLDNLNFLGNITTELINGVKLGEDAVSRRGKQDISTHKMFSRTASVLFNINMASNSTINNVDPSELQFSIATINTSVFEKNIKINSVSIKSLVLTDTEEFPLFDLRKKVWLKAETQVIPVHLISGNVEFEDLKINRLNSYELEHDFVHTRGIQDIIATKTFYDKVVVVNPLQLKDKININGVDISDISTVAIKENNEQILGKLIIKSLTVTGNMTVEMVNNFAMSEDVVQVFKQQNIGIKSFTKATITNSLVAADVLVGIVNDKSFLNIVKTAVTVHSATEMAVLNKVFENDLNAGKIEAYGLIDNCSISELVSRTVTLNTYQKIASDKNFTGDLEMNALTSKKVNDLNLQEYVNAVIRVNKNQQIKGKKTFNRGISTTNLNSGGTVNGIDLILLNDSAVFKTENNEIFSIFKFNSDIAVEKLIMGSNSKLDGTDVESVILLNWMEYLNNTILFQNYTKMKGNISVTGLINECNLKKVSLDSLYLSSDEQAIKSKNNIKYLKVKGNINMQSSVNHVDISLLNKTIVNFFDQELFRGHEFSKDLKTNYLLIEDIVNFVHLPFVFNDSVKLSSSQILEGKKFISSMKVKTLVLEDTSIQGLLNDVELNKLKSNTVMKYNSQEIKGKKTISEVGALKLKAKKNINDNKIPESMIMVYTSEIISTATFVIMETSISADLYVDGRVDNVFMQDFLNGRISLSENQKIDSHLKFRDDFTIKGTSDIIRTINNITVLEIVKTMDGSKIFGKKNFSNQLVIHGQLTCSHISNINVTDLGKNAIRTDGTEIIRNSVFQSEMRTFKLKIQDTVNKIFLDAAKFVYEREKIEQNLTDFHYLVNENANKLFHQFEEHKYQISTYVYFDLLQEIDLGPTKRFSPIPTLNSYGAHNIVPTIYMMVWLSNVVNCDSLWGHCCEFYTVVMKVLEDGSLEEATEKYPGRMFHFTLETGEKGEFLLYTNSTSAEERCEISLEGKTVVKNIHGNWLRNIKSADGTTVDSLSTLYIKDAKLLEVDNEIFLVMANIYKLEGDVNSIVLFKYDWLNKSWTEHQKIELQEPTSIDIIHLESPFKVIFLAAANRQILESQSIIYQWDYNSQYFFPIKNVSTSKPSSVLWVNIGNDIFVLFANEKTMLYTEYGQTSIYTNPIHIHKYHSKDFVWVQTVDVRGVSSLKTFRLAGETYVLAVSRHLQTIYVMQWKGYSGFQVIQEIPAPGVEDVSIFWLENEQLLLAVASSSGHTKVLKAAVRGSHLNSKHPFYKNINENLTLTDN